MNIINLGIVIFEFRGADWDAEYFVNRDRKPKMPLPNR